MSTCELIYLNNLYCFISTKQKLTNFLLATDKDHNMYCIPRPWTGRELLISTGYMIVSWYLVLYIVINMDLTLIIRIVFSFHEALQ